jgi:hypothetical protein
MVSHYYLAHLEETSYYGLCDLGSTINLISNTFYHKILDEIAPATIYNTDKTIKMADGNLRIPMGVVKHVYMTIGPQTYPIEFIVMDMPYDEFCPIIFGRTFLNNIKASIDCREETISLKFGEEQVKFHFSKFRDKPYRKDLEDEQGKTIAGLAAIFYGTPIEDQENLEGENANEDIEDEELGEYLDSIPIIDSPMNENMKSLKGGEMKNFHLHSSNHCPMG